MANALGWLDKLRIKSAVSGLKNQAAAGNSAPWQDFTQAMTSHPIGSPEQIGKLQALNTEHKIGLQPELIDRMNLLGSNLDEKGQKDVRDMFSSLGIEGNPMFPGANAITNPAPQVPATAGTPVAPADVPASSIPVAPGPQAGAPPTTDHLSTAQTPQPGGSNSVQDLLRRATTPANKAEAPPPIAPPPPVDKAEAPPPVAPPPPVEGTPIAPEAPSRLSPRGKGLTVEPGTPPVTESEKGNYTDTGTRRPQRNEMGVAQPASVTGALGSALGAAFHSLAGPDSGFADNALTTGVALLSGNVPGLASTVAKLATHPSTIIKGIKATMDAIGITNPAPQEMNGLLQWWMELPELAKIMIAGGGGLLAGAAISKMMGGPAALPAIAGAAGLAGGLSAAGEFGDQGNILKQLGWGGGAVTQPGKQNTSTSLMQALGMMPKPAVSTAPKAVFNPLAGVKPLGIDRPK